MLSLQLPLTTIVPSSRLPNYSFHSIKACSTAGKVTGERPNVGCFSSPIPKSRLAGASVSGASDEEKSAVQLQPELMPKHVAIIMDGNGRWAKNRNLPVHEGHRAGSQAMTALISNCCDLRIKTLTAFAFSKENWKRSQMEVYILMRTIENYIQSDVKEFIARNNVRFSAIGNKSRLPESLQSTISSAEEMSETNKGMHLVMAMSYSGRDDVVEAAKKIATKVEHGILRASDVDETMFEQQLMTNVLEFPDPDLLIRTSGELRISNFLLWQSAYTEFYFSDKLFPDFGEAHLLEAFASYQYRHRRYGHRRN